MTPDEERDALETEIETAIFEEMERDNPGVYHSIDFREGVERAVRVALDVVEQRNKRESKEERDRRKEAPLAELRKFAQASKALDGMIEEQVAACRFAGCSWADVGGELGISRQSAWTRFGGTS